jgi:hypothetical protein
MKRGTPGIGGLSFFLSLEWNRWEEDDRVGGHGCKGVFTFFSKDLDANVARKRLMVIVSFWVQTMVCILDEYVDWLFSPF